MVLPVEVFGVLGVGSVCCVLVFWVVGSGVVVLLVVVLELFVFELVVLVVGVGGLITGGGYGLFLREFVLT